jgi:hypothetical protein
MNQPILFGYDLLVVSITQTLESAGVLGVFYFAPTDFSCTGLKAAVVLYQQRRNILEATGTYSTTVIQHYGDTRWTQQIYIVA